MDEVGMGMDAVEARGRRGKTHGERRVAKSSRIGRPKTSTPVAEQR